MASGRKGGVGRNNVKLFMFGRECFFRAIRNNVVSFDFDDWITADEGQCIVLLEKFDLTADMVVFDGDWAEAKPTGVDQPTWCAGRARSAAWRVAPFNRAHDQIIVEFRKTQKVKGYACLVEQNVIWISHYDMTEAFRYGSR